MTSSSDLGARTLRRPRPPITGRAGTAEQTGVRTASVLLVDEAGRILLQLRDGDAPIGPNQWAIPGGHIEPGELPEAAARRELREETGIEAGDALELFWHGLRTFGPELGHAEWNVYCARTEATQRDVILGEGAAMVFMPTDQIDSLPLVSNASFFLPLFRASYQYQKLCRGRRIQ